MTCTPPSGAMSTTAPCIAWWISAAPLPSRIWSNRASSRRSSSGFRSHPRRAWTTGRYSAASNGSRTGSKSVQSLFPGWRFQAADTVAAFGLHGALAIGEPQPVSEYNVDFWLARLATFETTLMCNGAEMDRGHAGNVLGGGPVTALQSIWSRR